MELLRPRTHSRLVALVAGTILAMVLAGCTGSVSLAPSASAPSSPGPSQPSAEPSTVVSPSAGESPEASVWPSVEVPPSPSAPPAASPSAPAGSGAPTASPAASPASSPARSPTATPAPPRTLEGRGAVAGTVTSGPTCPVARWPPDPKCADRPVPGATIVALDHDGRAYGRATTDAAGGYRIELPPGVWMIRAVWMQAFRGTTAEQTVVVHAGLTATADFIFDTGIR